MTYILLKKKCEIYAMLLFFRLVFCFIFLICIIPFCFSSPTHENDFVSKWRKEAHSEIVTSGYRGRVVIENSIFLAVNSVFKNDDLFVNVLATKAGDFSFLDRVSLERLDSLNEWQGLDIDFFEGFSRKIVNENKVVVVPLGVKMSVDQAKEGLYRVVCGSGKEFVLYFNVTSPPEDTEGDE